MIKFLLAVALVTGYVNAGTTPPEFAVVVKSTGDFRIYSQFTRSSGTTYTVSDSVLSATIEDMGSDRWRLTVRPTVTLMQTFFPWQTARAPLNANINDDVYYYPILLGVAEQATMRNTDWAWYGGLYPGMVTAPFVITADDTNAKIVAAINWPPKAVRPWYAAQRMVLNYTEDILPGGSSSYTAIQADVTGNASIGNPPWMVALERYKSWYKDYVPAPYYPGWMWSGDGFVNVQLQGWGNNFPKIQSVWDTYKARFPWILFWGQMSEWGTDCCALSQPLNWRYQSVLPNFARTETAKGYHVGFYSTSYYGTSASDPARTLDTPAGLNWLTSWLNTNAAAGANSFYIDTISRMYVGDPAVVANLFRNGTIPQNSLIEGFVDLYPSTALVSSSLIGDDIFCGAPQKTPQNSTRATFPRLLRYLADDRLMYWGESNDDWRFWGASQSWLAPDPVGYLEQFAKCNFASYCANNGPCEYGTERQVFLLGTKFEITSPLNGKFLPGGGSPINPTLDAIIAERNRVNWWARQPRYMDVNGLTLTTIPNGSAVEIRRHKANDGRNLITISNPKLLSGLSFKMDNVVLAVPAQSISILDVN